MNIIDTSNRDWSVAKKTQGIRARPFRDLFSSEDIAKFFLVRTLEGDEPVHFDNVLCIGGAGDSWQQSLPALHKKYDVFTEAGGWMQCLPKPENSVQFFEVQEDGYLVGLWGATVNGVPNLQHFSKGDFICRQPHQHEDQWVVRRRLFLNTYKVQS